MSALHHAPASRNPARRLFLIAALLALPLLLPCAAGAAEGLFLSWNDCPLGPTASSNRVFACNTNDGQDELIVAFTMPEAADNVIATEIVLDLQHASSPLPDWWRLDGSCRPATSLAASADFGGLTACTDMWGGAQRFASVQGYTPSEPRGADSQARIKITSSVLPQDAVTLDGTSMYYAVRVVIKRDLTVGGQTCSGCEGAACLVLNSVLIGRVPGNPDYFLQTPGSADGNWARWQGPGANCAAVPVRARAWGQLKSQYR